VQSIAVTVSDVNEAPVTAADSGSVLENTEGLAINSVTIDVLTNDGDPEGATLSVVSATDPANGSLVDNGDGTFSYTPDTGFSGIDTFTYDVTDGTNTQTGEVSVRVNGDEITPEVIFGSGNANGSFTTSSVETEAGTLELSLRAKLRFDADNLPQNTFNANGDGSYTFDNDVAPLGFPESPGVNEVQELTTPIWSFEWAVNTDTEATGAGDVTTTLDSYTYVLTMDADPGAGVGSSFAADPIIPTPGFPTPDAAIGTNDTANGGGTSTSDPTTYSTLISTQNVAQNSVNYAFLAGSIPEFATFDPTAEGVYTITARL